MVASGGREGRPTNSIFLQLQHLPFGRISNSSRQSGLLRKSGYLNYVCKGYTKNEMVLVFRPLHRLLGRVDHFLEKSLRMRSRLQPCNFFFPSGVCR